MIKKSSILIILIASATLMADDAIGFNINGDSIEVESHTDVTGYIQTDEDTTKYKIETNYLNTPYSYLFGAGFTANGDIEAVEGLKFAVGAKLMMSDNKQDSFFALPLLAKAIYKLPLEDIPPAFVSAHLLYAPGSLSFSNADSYTEFRVQTDVDVIDNVSVYSGYRSIDTDYEKYDKTLDQSIYGGLKLSF
ncbi:MAG: hypothetical protein KU38_11660 [Sulfurovum sp. FS08-3]|nr:MAG: hypothetical protein KU38_11660 [Sulfurovum sp. FS08-3]